MTIQASGRSAFILAAAFAAAFVLGTAYSGSSRAAEFGSSALQLAAPDRTAPSLAADQTDPQPGTPAQIADATDTGAMPATDATAASMTLASSDDSSGWDKASLIGKIFIACGTLLTLGSAARMFMI